MHAHTLHVLEWCIPSRTELSRIHTFITATKSNYRDRGLAISLISCGDWVNWKSFVNFNFPVLCLYYLLLEFSVGPEQLLECSRRFMVGIHYSYLVHNAKCYFEELCYKLFIADKVMWVFRIMRSLWQVTNWTIYLSYRLSEYSSKRAWRHN